MNKKILLIPFICSLLSAETVKSRAYDNTYAKNYEQSSNIGTTEDRVISSTAEASAQITVVVTIQVISEVTSRTNTNMATMSFLNNNRTQITEEIAKGEGEHLQTLLTMMKLKYDKKNLKNIQNNFEEFIYLSHDDFLKKLTLLS